MKTFRSIVAVFAFAAIFAISGFAQTPAPAGKLGVVNTNAFADSKGGITKYITALTSLEKEMQPDMTALQTMGNKIQSLEKELTDLQNQLNNEKLPPAVDKAKLQTTAQTKYQEYQDLGRQFKVKQEDYKVKLERREAAVVSPISRDIMGALQEFGKKNGYMMILDASKLDGAGLLLAFDEKYDVTKDFITFYNARPATTAAVK
jgi:Skp family chaperone for outer membrane proteins